MQSITANTISRRGPSKRSRGSLAITQKQKQIDEHISADKIPAEIEKLKALMKVASISWFQGDRNTGYNQFAQTKLRR
ncbi:MAG: hypothetical protein ACLRTQ_09245 [Candidatus Borkfalkia sp.]